MPLRFWLARLFGRKLVGRDGDHYVIAYHWRGCTMTSSRWFPDIGRKPKGWRPLKLFPRAMIGSFKASAKPL
jgi:hypothetical protein